MKLRGTVVVIALWAAACGALRAQEQPGGGGEGFPTAALYRRLGSVGLDKGRVYRIRDASIEREDLHISLNDGIIAFTQTVDGRITGALFEGDGDILLRPPDRVERWSLSQFTGAAILEEQFTSAYLRFNDETFSELQEYLRPLQTAATPADEEIDGDADEPNQGAAKRPATPEAFLDKWDQPAHKLAELGVLRLLLTFVDAGSATGWQPRPHDRFLMASLASPKLGAFQVYYDSLAAEQITVAQSRVTESAGFYNIWTSFPSRSVRERIPVATATVQTQAAAERPVDPVHIPHYAIKAQILSSRVLRAETTLDLQTSEPGHRLLIFELSRFLNVKEVTLDGRRLEFVQNEAIEGSELSKRGNDNIAVVIPEALSPSKPVRLRFVYEGEVLSDAGGGLMYVGARGIWYPNRGFSMSDFDMEFRYPDTWTLVATGKRVAGSEHKVGGEQVAHYVSERPMPVAGFNIGLYMKAEARAGTALVQTFASREMENAFPRQATVALPTPSPGLYENPSTTLAPQAPPAPSAHAQEVAAYTAHTVRFLSERLGPFPYSTLSITQIPGENSQSWPGLVYLSGYSFLSAEELNRAHVPLVGQMLYRRLMPAHETAHQWWGDLLMWNSYREQWLVEALSNYSVLLMIEKEDPFAFRFIMDQYRQSLMQTKEGHALSDAGPVTLGGRLASSRFPQAYESIAYGRGTWLFHMLRHMLADADAIGTRQRSKAPAGAAADDRFFTVLRRVRERFEGREITTRDLQQAFEESLPPALQYEGRKSLDWFFDDWVNGTAVPQIELSQLKLTTRRKDLLATGHILQKHVPDDFVTSVPLYAELSSGNRVLIGRVYAEGPDTAFQLSAPEGSARILLDPYMTVLRK